jgi:hypothetical protein
MTFSEGSIGINSCDFKSGNGLLNKTPKAQTTNKLDFIIIILCVWESKNTVNKMKRQHTEWKKTSPHYISDKDLISRINEEFMQLKNKHTH